MDIITFECYTHKWLYHGFYKRHGFVVFWLVLEWEILEYLDKKIWEQCDHNGDHGTKPHGRISQEINVDQIIRTIEEKVVVFEEKVDKKGEKTITETRK